MMLILASYVKKKVIYPNEYYSYYSLNIKSCQALFLNDTFFTFNHALQIYGSAPVDIYFFKRHATSYSARQKITLELRGIVKMKARVES